MSTLKDLMPAGVVVGDDVQKVFAYAKAHHFALPAANCTGTNTVNACLLYTSDAADERSRGDLGGRRTIKKKTRAD